MFVVHWNEGIMVMTLLPQSAPEIVIMPVVNIVKA